MSAGYCKVTLIGNLGRDPETRYTPEGVIFLSFSMATSKKYYDRAGVLQERTTWFKVTTWRKLAETMDQLAQQGALVKGRQVFVAGSLEPREYTDGNGKQISLDVQADDIQLLGSKMENVNRNKTVFPTPNSVGPTPSNPMSTSAAGSVNDADFSFNPWEPGS